MQTERNIIKTPNSRKYARVHTKQQLRQRQKRRLKRHRLADWYNSSSSRTHSIKPFNMLFLLLFNLLYGIDSGTSIASKLFLVVAVTNTIQLMDYWILYSSARIPRNDQYSDEIKKIFLRNGHARDNIYQKKQLAMNGISIWNWNENVIKSYWELFKSLETFFFVDNNFRCLFGFIACFQYFYIFLYSVNAYYFCSFSLSQQNSSSHGVYSVCKQMVWWKMNLIHTM